MVRATVGVIVAFVLMALFVLAFSMGIWFALGIDGVLRPGVFAGTALLNIYSVLAALLGAVIAGWLCAKISRSQTALIVFAALCFVLGTVNAIMQLNKPDPGPRARAHGSAGHREEEGANLVHIPHARPRIRQFAAQRPPYVGLSGQALTVVVRNRTIDASVLFL